MMNWMNWMIDDKLLKWLMLMCDQLMMWLMMRACSVFLAREIDQTFSSFRLEDSACRTLVS